MKFFVKPKRNNRENVDSLENQLQPQAKRRSYGPQDSPCISNKELYRTVYECLPVFSP